MPRETLKRLLDLALPVQFIHGNGELAALALLAAPDENAVTYWGTTSGKPLPESLRPGYRWCARQLQPEYEHVIATWPRTLHLEIPELGEVQFCHGTPRSETEVFTRLTAENRLIPIFEPLHVSLVVCGHTHMQFDRMIGQTRVVNAGSVGEPFGQRGAYWLLLGSDVQLRRTQYDLTKAAERIRATQYPGAEDSAKNILQPPSEAEILEAFGKAELQ
jgi:diadenosine tetraphosphatase ApaH/serine/threonine PP2A family protein phosphatase